MKKQLLLAIAIVMMSSVALMALNTKRYVGGASISNGSTNTSSNGSLTTSTKGGSNTAITSAPQLVEAFSNSLGAVAQACADELVKMAQPNTQDTPAYQATINYLRGTQG